MILLLRSVVGFVLRYTRSFIGHLYSARLTEAERIFIDQNSAYWNTRGSVISGSGYVFIEEASHPVLCLCNAAFGTMLTQASNLKPLFLQYGPNRTKQRQILESYPNAEFVYVLNWRLLPGMFSAYFRARKIYRSLKIPTDLLEVEVDGLNVGHILYDVVLSYGFASVHDIDQKAFRALFEFFKTRHTIKNILASYGIEKAVITQLVGLAGGTYATYLIQEGVEIYCRSGSYQLLLRKYRAPEEMGISPVTPDPAYLNGVLEDDEILKVAETYLEKRLEGRVTQIGAALAFDRSKLVFTEAAGFCETYHLDPSKPVVFVMLHAFNDWPHWNYPKRMLYVDYYHWFRATLEIAQSVDSVNWVFKEHPAAHYYLTRDLDVGATVNAVDRDNVLFLDGQAKFNTGSLRHFAHAIVTGVGTAGLEGAAYGVPCVLAGECSYSGHGFTVEPETTAEYEDLLRQIDGFQRLNEDQVKIAKAVAYLYFRINSSPFHFCPRFEDDQISFWQPEYTEALWAKAAGFFKDPAHVVRMDKQRELISRYVSDDSWIQYVGLDKPSETQFQEDGE